MVTKSYLEIIQQYIKAYNTFDVEGMMVDMADDVVFENITDGVSTLKLKGLEAFKNQAMQAVQLFSKREQKITAINQEADEVMVDIDYHAILKIDLPNGLKSGDKLQLKGQSKFTFHNNKITRLVDLS